MSVPEKYYSLVWSVLIIDINNTNNIKWNIALMSNFLIIIIIKITITAITIITIIAIVIEIVIITTITTIIIPVIITVIIIIIIILLLIVKAEVSALHSCSRHLTLTISSDQLFCVEFVEIASLQNIIKLVHRTCILKH